MPPPVLLAFVRDLDGDKIETVTYAARESFGS